jgi:15-cis-phytoene synthase
MSLIKTHAYTLYAQSLFMSQDKRSDVLTLYEFYVELATIRQRIQNSIAGEVRLQWWKDSLLRAEPLTPLLKDILRLIETYNLPLKTFTNMCEARVFDMYDDNFKNWSEFEGYCGETICAILQLTALILNEGKRVETAELAGYAGLAYALTFQKPFEDTQKMRETYLKAAQTLYKTCPPHLKPAFRLYNVNGKLSNLRQILRVALN